MAVFNMVCGSTRTQQGEIQAKWGASDNNRLAKFYSLTL